MTRGHEGVGAAAPKVWPVFVSFVVAFALLLAVSIAGGIGLLLLFGGKLERVEAFFLTLPGLSFATALSVLVLSGVSVAGARFSKIPISERLVLGRLPQAAPPILAITASSVGLVATSAAFGLAVSMMGFKDTGVLAKITDAVTHAGLPALLLSLVCIAIGPAIGEELYFRGFVQSRLVERWGPARAIAITSLLFGLFHMDLKQGAFAVMAGAILGWVAHRAGSTRASMIVHGINNGTSLVLTWLGADLEKGGPRPLVLAVVCAVAVIALAFAAARFRAGPRRRA